MSVAAQREVYISDETSSPFYFNASHWRAMDGIMQGVQERSGLMVLTGPTGSGKTMLMRAIADDLEEGASPLFLQYASLNFREFVNFLHKSLKVEDEIIDASNKAVALRKFLYAQAERNETSVVFIDEAQNLEPDVLKMLPKLSCFDSLEDGRVVGMQFVLVGGSELREFLDDADFDDVRASVSHNFDLRFFTREELKHFLEKRLAPIARMTPEPITDDAIEAVGKYTGGSPRLIGMICSHAMLFAAEHPGRSIDESMIEEAAEALMLEPVENAFAHEDDELELTGPFSSADLKGENELSFDTEKEVGDFEETASIADDQGYDDDAVDQVANSFVSDSGSDQNTAEYANELDDVLDDIEGSYGEEHDEHDEADIQPTEATASGSIIEKVKSAITLRNRSRGNSAEVLGATRKSRRAEREVKPTAKRKMKTRVSGDRERQVRAGIMFASVLGVAFGAYMIRGPVIEAFAGVKNTVSAKVSGASETLSAAATTTVDVQPSAIDFLPSDTAVVAVNADAPEGSDSGDIVVASLDPASVDSSSGQGWGAKVTVDKPIETSGQQVAELPAPAVDIARGALDLVDRVIDAGANNAPEAVRGALEQASSDVASLRKTVTENGADSTEVSARVAGLVTQGDEMFANQLYIAPRGGNAYEAYRKALDLDPENEAALLGVEKLRAFYSTKAENARAAKQWDTANRHFETALAISRLRPVR